MSGRFSSRCRSEISRIIDLLGYDFGLLDDYVFHRHVLVACFHGGGDALDLLDNVHDFDHFTEYGVAPTLNGRCAVVEEAVVGDVDEELRAGRVRFHGAGHGDGADLVGDAIVGFVLDRCAGRLLLHARLETTALDHEVTDHAVENGAVIMTV